MTNPVGRKAVELYYIYSPPLADLISESETLRAISRLALTPVVMLIAHPNTSLLAFFMFFTAIFSSLIVYRKQ